MDDDDYVMGEETILKTTEGAVNGDHASGTVDPSMLALDGSHGPSFAHLRPQFPILDHAETGQSNLAPPSFHPTGNLNVSAMEDDEMEDVSYPLPKRSLVEVRIPPRPTYKPLPYSSGKTGIVYDARMRFHQEPSNAMLREDDIHPEDPRRIHEIFKEIQDAGLVQESGADEKDAHDHQCWRIYPRPATRGEVCLIHHPEHYARMEVLADKTEEELRELSDLGDSVYFNSSTFECARLAAGGAIEACRAVVRGDVRNAFAIIRPPGHHAECHEPAGFCIFNNVPIATRVCQNDFPQQCRKVFILDWDVHHGNGIQHAFEDDPNVLYISLHVYKNGNFYPHSKDGDLDKCGIGAGLGKNVNIPWPDQGMGDAEYLYAFQQVVMPIATEFDPDLVIISAGFDAAEGDMLGACHVTPAAYAHMTHMLMSLAQGKVAVCLEGGYNLRSIARSALAVTRTLMLEPPERLAEDLGPPRDDAVRTIDRIKREHAKYWKCMLPKEPEREGPTAPSALRLHEVIREWQSNVLRESHFMSPLKINSPELSQTFQHNVLATQKCFEAKPLLLIFHDPPDIMNRPNPVSGEIDPHNSWLTDETKSYIDWAISEGFEVIDVNIPLVVSDLKDEIGYIEADDIETRARQTRELATYLWENYIEPFDATQVFLMGIGAAYQGLVDLLSTNESTTDGDKAIECLIGFVCESAIHSIKRATDDYISSWFHDHSLVFVASNHHVWAPTRVRRIRKKYGKLQKSGSRTLPLMLAEHRAEIQQLLLEMKNEYEEEHGTSGSGSGESSGAQLASANAGGEQKGHLESDHDPSVGPGALSGLRVPASTAASGVGSGGRGGLNGSGNGKASGGSTTPKVKSPRLPQIGLFAAPSPARSPKSPMKRL